jgi:GNAT superfamily N-acetyltransferase
MQMAEQQLIVRDATREDLLALSNLMNDLGYQTSSEEMQIRFDLIYNHRDYKTFIACLDKKVVGMAGATQSYFYEQNGRYVRLLAFVISPSYRHKGIGKFLLQAVEDWVKEIGSKTILLNCGNREERKHAHEFYQKRGYRIKSSGYMKKL